LCLLVIPTGSFMLYHLIQDEPFFMYPVIFLFIFSIVWLSFAFCKCFLTFVYVKRQIILLVRFAPLAKGKRNITGYCTERWKHLLPLSQSLSRSIPDSTRHRHMFSLLSICKYVCFYNIIYTVNEKIRVTRKLQPVNLWVLLPTSINSKINRLYASGSPEFFRSAPKYISNGRWCLCTARPSF